MENLDLSSLHGKLYDRTKQESKLVDAYRRVLLESLNERRRPEFILISGPSGTGKTSLAQILREPVENDGGFFISGKFEFDQVERPQPFAPLVTAFTELVNFILSRDDNDKMKESIQHALDSEGSTLLLDMIPALMKLTPESTSSKQNIRHQNNNYSIIQEQQHHSSDFYLKHFHSVFCRFAKSVCSIEHPLVLFLDDLQWADSSSLDLIYALTTELECQGLAIVASCRDNVPPDSYLSNKLRDMEGASVKITNVGVRNLKEPALHELLCDLLNDLDKRDILEIEQLNNLTRLVFHKTNGNMLYVMEFLQYLTTEKLLYFSDKADVWIWEEEATIRQHQENLLLANKMSNGTSCTVTVVDLICERASRLAPFVQDFLTIASCIGARFDEKVVSCAYDLLSGGKHSVAEAINESAKAGFIRYDSKLGVGTFVHDNIQQAAYSLIPRDQRIAFHLELGRALWKNLSPKDLDNYVFVVLNQVDRGVQCVTEQQEKYGIASLCLLAGRKAIKSSGFHVASEYLDSGISLLGGECWHDEYDLTLALYNSAAEVEFVTANFQRMDELIGTVLLNAKCLRDKLSAHATQVYSLGARDQKVLAIDTGLAVLNELGESFPRNVRASHITAEAIKVKRLLGGKTDEALVRLPLMVDPDKLAAMQMLNLLFRNTYSARPSLVPLIVLRMVRITLRHGASVVASVGFAEYGMMLCGIHGDPVGGYRFGQLALSLLERFKSTEWLPRVYVAVYGGGINHWMRPLSNSLEPLKFAHEIGLESGDIETSMLAINMYQYHSLHCGKPIPVLEKEVRANHEVMVAYKQHSGIGLLRPFWQMLLNMMGRCEDPLVLKGEVYDEKEGLKIAKERNLKILSMSIHYIKMVLACYVEQYATAEKMAQGCKDAEKLAIGSHTVALVTFFHGMTVLALARDSEGNQKKKRLAIARKLIKKTRRRAFYSPQTYLDQQCLLEAEYASICGQNEIALAKYICAIALTGEHGIHMIHALANERAGSHYFRLNGRKEESLGRPYLEKAYLTYLEMGALTKTNYLKSKFPWLQDFNS